MPSPSTSTAIADQLDRFEQRLPKGLPRASFRLQRTLAARAVDVAERTGRTVWRSTAAVAATQRHAFNTVVGTARAAADSVLRAGKTLRGQTVAQAGRARRATVVEADKLIDAAKEGAVAAGHTATDAVEATEVAVRNDVAPTRETYDDLTKSELYRRAKALDIEGRSQMSKRELIRALEAAA